jgi:hypothetical protein
MRTAQRFAGKVAAKGPDAVAGVHASHGAQVDGRIFDPDRHRSQREADIPMQAVQLNDVPAR